MSRALLFFGLFACRSAGSSYYTLLAPATDAPAPATAELQLDVLPVDVPADVDRVEIVVRTGAGEVTPVQTRSWIAPLALELRHAFSDDLTRATGARDIAGVTPTEGVPIIRVKLAVQRFESVLGKHALIEAVSTIRDSSGTTPALVCSHRASEDAGSGYSGLAEGHQHALAAIAKQIAESIRSVRANAPACAK